MAKHSADKKAQGKKNRAKGTGRKGTGETKKRGAGTLKAGSALKKSQAASQVGRTAPNGDKRVSEGGGTHYRTEGTIKRLKMYQSKPNEHKRRMQADKPMRIQPDRRWFGNTRVIAQDKMQAFRETLSKGVEDPFSVVLKSSKLPMSLLRDTQDKATRMDLLSVEPFKEVFSKGRRQKRVKLGSYDLEGLLQSADKKAEDYSEVKDTQSKVDISSGLEKAGKDGHHSEEIFLKGTSKRIWGELWKVVDCSDVLIFVLDARDPMGTRCEQLEREIRKNRPHKHIVLLLNKVDLVPTWVSRKWINILMKEFPTLAFHASITHPFGKNALLNLLRQFGNLLKESKHVTVGMIGYPNVGKSSVINTMKHKKVCKAAPIPGETKVWQYITLTKRIYLLDCPGIVTGNTKDFEGDTAKVLKGVVRAERIENPSDYIDEVVSRVKHAYLVQRYKLPEGTTWKDGEEFLSIVAVKYGKLLKGGDPDCETAARIVLYDWQRGRIPYFTPPPETEAEKAAYAEKAAIVQELAAAEAKDGAPVSTADGASAEPAANKPAAGAAAAEPEEKPAGESESEEEEESAGEEAPGQAASSAAAGGKRRQAGDGASVQQSLDGLAAVPIALQFDEEDMRGEKRGLAAGQAAAAAMAADGKRPATAQASADGADGSKKKEEGSAWKGRRYAELRTSR